VLHTTTTSTHRIILFHFIQTQKNHPQNRKKS
jgi:hypothetical protein